MKDIINIIKNWKKAQTSNAMLPCPRCGKTEWEYKDGALSRRADVKICATCGTQEAMQDYNARKTMESVDFDFDKYNEAQLSSWWISTNVLGKQSVVENAKGNFEVTAKRTMIFSKTDIDDIVCTALEGGITYWCCKAVVGEDEYYGEYASDQISRGGTLILYDTEEDERYTLTLEKLINGIAKACDEGYGDFCDIAEDGKSLDNNVEMSRLDSIAADIIIQYALFGEIVYG